MTRRTKHAGRLQRTADAKSRMRVSTIDWFDLLCHPSAEVSRCTRLHVSKYGLPGLDKAPCVTAIADDGPSFVHCLALSTTRGGMCAWERMWTGSTIFARFLSFSLFCGWVILVFVSCPVTAFGLRRHWGGEEATHFARQHATCRESPPRTCFLFAVKSKRALQSSQTMRAMQEKKAACCTSHTH